MQLRRPAVSYALTLVARPTPHKKISVNLNFEFKTIDLFSGTDFSHWINLSIKKNNIRCIKTNYKQQMEKILNFKHWHLFILIVLLGAWTSPSPLKEIINSIAGLTFLTWIYSIGVFGQEKLKELGLQTSDTKFFKINIFLIALLTVTINLFSKETTDFEISDIIIVPFALYLIFSIFYTAIFAIKTLTKIELKKEIEFSDWILNFIMLIILFVGIWFIQPKVNKYLGTAEQ